MKPLKIHVTTLGCPKNLVDSEVLMGQCRNGTTRLVTDVDDADVAVINTCGFIEPAKRESLDAIFEAVERKKQGALQRVIVFGCLAERYRQQLQTEIPEVDGFFGTSQMPEVLRSIGVDYKSELLGERLLCTPAHTAYLKISEGCDRPCAFCAIPLMRGIHRSRELEEIVDEGRRLADNGVKEIVIIGQDTTYYGLDRYGTRRLHDVLLRLSEIEEIQWIRLMYAYPSGFPIDVLHAMRESPKICRYIDLPLQHVSDPVLRSMRRGITRSGTEELLETIRKLVPDIAVRTTFLVGYPTESDEAFDELVEFVRSAAFERMGVFQYSREEGTAAYDLGDPVPAAVKEERYARLMSIQQELSRARNEALVGTTLKVLCDRREQDILFGRTEWDAPEIDQEVIMDADAGADVGNYSDVTIVDSTEYDLRGAVANK